MTYYYYKTSTLNTGQPMVSDQKLEEWKHLADKGNWRITQLPNGYYQTEVNNPTDKEKWVDVSRKDKDGKHPACGRSKANKSSKGYPKCRPSVKVSGKTPKTSGSMSEGQKRAATKRKRAKKQGVGGKPTIVKSVLVVRTK